MRINNTLNSMSGRSKVSEMQGQGELVFWTVRYRHVAVSMVEITVLYEYKYMYLFLQNFFKFSD